MAVFYSIICIKGERSKFFTKIQLENFLQTSSAIFLLLKDINTEEPVPDR